MNGSLIILWDKNRICFENGSANKKWSLMKRTIPTRDPSFDNQGNKRSQISKNIIVIRVLQHKLECGVFPKFYVLINLVVRDRCNFILKYNSNLIGFCCLIACTRTQWIKRSVMNGIVARLSGKNRGRINFRKRNKKLSLIL